MARRKRKEYDDIHNYVERIEDVLLSESSWSTSDSECSGCLHLSKGSTLSESEVNVCDNDKLELFTLASSDLFRKGSRSKFLKTKIINNSFKKQLVSENNLSFVDSLSATGVPCSSVTTGLDNSTGGMLQQLSLLTAGAQPWHYNICAVHHKKFAYAATLVIYIYQIEGEGNDWQLYSILADHRKTITCINWHPNDADILASSSVDQRICVWSVSQQSVLQAINICKIPILVSWFFGCKDTLSFTTQSGPIQLWNYTDGLEPSCFREDHGYSSGIVAYAWHPTIPKRLIVGHQDGRLSLYREDTTKVRHSMFLEGLDDGEGHPCKIKTFAWDYNSPDYLLIAYQEGKLWLIDVNTFKIVTKYSLPGSSTVATLAWLPDAPGMFVTGDLEKGILRIWSVSKLTPLENCRLKDTGFHCLSIPLTNYDSNRDTSCFDENKGPVIPRVSVLTLFTDGGIGIYHLKRKEWMFNREHGHTETIFDCSFKPEDSDLLATSSFDGSIKIWKVDSMETVETLPNRDAIIYSVSWAPVDLNCIAAGTSCGEVFIWNISTNRIIQEFKMHKDKKVFCVSWNMNDSRKIASTGESCFCFVHQVSGVNGLLVQSYRHPGPVYGCHWRDQDILATGCEDGKIRIYNVNKSSKDPVVELKAHQKKVFGVMWNPVYRDILCSGSDDTAIKIWSFSKAQCLSVLVGHSNNVRGLVWCPEIPTLLISGSWDQTMRVWDAKSCICLDVVSDHRADVYGLSIHPLRPFLLASCSRDSTVRLWSLSSIVTPLYLKVFASRPLEEIIGEKDVDGGLSPSMKLCGLRAEHLLSTVKKVDANVQRVRSLKLFADLFCADVHLRNLWDLVYVLLGISNVSSLSPQYTSSIVHHSHLLKCALASAEEKEQSLSSCKGVNNLRISTHEGQESLASLYLQYGALQQYCDLMVKLRKWDHALALAPAVSLDYWRELMERHANELLADDNEACVPYLVASNDSDKLIHFHVMRGHLDKALSSCMAISKPPSNSQKGVMPLPPVPPRNRHEGGQIENIELNERLMECARRVGDWHMKKGTSISAACSFLAVDNIEDALKALIQGHEIELVVVVGELLSGKPNITNGQIAMIEDLRNLAKGYLVYKAIKCSSFTIALDIVHSITEERERALKEAEVLIAFTGDAKEVESLRSHAGCPLPGELDSMEGKSPHEEVLYGLLSSHPQKGLNRGLELLQDFIIKKHLNSSELWAILKLLQALPLAPSGMGTLSTKTERKATLLAISAFLGAIKAAVVGYSSIVLALLDHSSALIQKYGLSDLEFLQREISQVKALYESGNLESAFNLSEISKTWLDRGLTKVSGSQLPRHADNHVCCITHQIIKGPVYFLEDDISVLGLNDALMWTKVHPFSPLGTGLRINPF